MPAILHLGTNQGARSTNLERAIQSIQDKIGKVTTQSSVYETAAWGKTDQSDFLNQTIIVETELNPTELLATIHQIEGELGRVRIEKWGPRVIDIDILFFEDKIIEKPQLTIPHPHLQNRNFVLIPTMEIAGDFIHPVLNMTIEELYLASRDTGEVYLLESDNNHHE